MAETSAVQQRLELIEFRIRALPSLPSAVHQVLDLVAEPESTVAQLVEALLMDQGMTTRVLRVANSPYYGFLRKIETVTQAVALLGKTEIGDHVVSTAMHGFLGERSPGAFDRRAFWDYSFACAQCTKVLLRLAAHPAERAYVCALIHDMGKLIIDECWPLEHGRILSMAQQCGWPAERAEQEVLGVDHTQVGAMLAERWDFPPLLVNTVRNHHTGTEHMAPGSAEMQIRTLLDLADRLVRSEGIGHNGDYSAPEIPEEMWFPLGLNSSHREKVISQLKRALGGLGALVAV
ncbi:MAG: HDOD domain-containing protein [Candidatus Sumerlaeia bacterium]|nr:HDOD domain-containing protein [Candidatus Sumerlaeia bacterium]